MALNTLETTVRQEIHARHATQCPAYFAALASWLERHVKYQTA
jgi:hypothetical protein